MRLHRFYVEQPLGEDVVIDDVSLIKQWANVFRYSKGDFVILFNGDGYDCRYAIASFSGKDCLLSLTEKKLLPAPDKKSFLYLSLIKKDAFELVVQKAVELGITDIVPLITERTEKKNLDYRRLRMITKEATEQSGQTVLPLLYEAIAFTTIEEDLLSHDIDAKRALFFSLEGAPWQELLGKGEKRGGGSVACIIGPEGGWTQEEESFAKRSGFTKVSVGRLVLRADTAGIVASFLSKLF